MNDLIQASVVWDGGEEVIVPPQMGTPREDQLQGTVGEKLSELAGRVCYDSLGKGRASQDYHKHILEVGHLSTVEHYNFTFQVAGPRHLPQVVSQLLPFLVNRPGLWVEFGFWEPDLVAIPGDVHSPFDKQSCLRLTMNYRTLLDWPKFCEENEMPEIASRIGAGFTAFMSSKGPMILGGGDQEASANAILQGLGLFVRHLEPKYPQEKWASLFLSGSRGMSHELVRHGDRTAISQRSTRYVQENESHWVQHPLLDSWMSVDPSGSEEKARLDEVAEETYNTRQSAKISYKLITASLESWLTSKGVDKLHARKQARGAARGFLGNALYTELIFSASVAAWRHIITMRAADAADAEIRELAIKALKALQGSRYKDDFKDMELIPAEDGLGECLKGGGHK